MSKYLGSSRAKTLLLLEMILKTDEKLYDTKEWIIKPMMKLDNEDFYKILVIINKEFFINQVSEIYMKDIYMSLEEGNLKKFVSSLLNFELIDPELEDVIEKECITLNYMLEKSILNNSVKLNFETLSNLRNKIHKKSIFEYKDKKYNILCESF